MAPPRQRQTVDASDHSCVMVCSCGVRDVAASPVTAWSLAVDHARRVHGDSRRAYHALTSARRRASLTAAGPVR